MITCPACKFEIKHFCKCSLQDGMCERCGKKSHNCPECHKRVEGPSFHASADRPKNICSECKPAATLTTSDPSIVVLVEALRTMKAYAAVTLDHWDEDQDAKVGKRLKALAGLSPGYDSRLDAVFAVLDGIVVDGPVRLS